MRVFIAAAAVASALLMAGSASAQTLHFTAVLNGASETPPNSEKGTGTVQATLDNGSKALNYTATYSGLTGPALMAHFHGPAAPGASAPPVVAAPSASSPITGTATLTDEQIAQLKSGMWYFNVHTAAHRGGEVRGQVTPAG